MGKDINFVNDINYYDIRSMIKTTDYVWYRDDFYKVIETNLVKSDIKNYYTVELKYLWTKDNAQKSKIGRSLFISYDEEASIPFSYAPSQGMIRYHRDSAETYHLFLKDGIVYKLRNGRSFMTRDDIITIDKIAFEMNYPYDNTTYYVTIKDNSGLLTKHKWDNFINNYYSYYRDSFSRARLTTVMDYAKKYVVRTYAVSRTMTFPFYGKVKDDVINFLDRYSMPVTDMKMDTSSIKQRDALQTGAGHYVPFDLELHKCILPDSSKEEVKGNQGSHCINCNDYNEYITESNFKCWKCKNGF